ncbi:MAG: adenylate cyclase [Mycobacterium sp.]|nr:adenylate cyclase [Mycobacterium sp.]
MKLARPRLTRRGMLAAAVAAAVAILVLVLYAAGVLDNFDRQSVDERFSWRGGQSPGSEIVIVGIDQKTLQTLGTKPPLPRSDYAQVLDHVRAASPRMIGIDTQFIGRSDPTDDNALLAAIARDGPVLLGTHDGPQGPMTVPADVADAPGAVVASAAIDKDPDGVLRRMLYAPVRLETFAVRAAEMLRNQPVNPADFPGNHAWIDFRGPPGTFPHYSFADVLAGTVPASAFTGKAVFIGVTDPVDDVFVTSISSVPMPGVEVHANALWTVLAGLPLKSAGGPVDVALILALIAILAAIGARQSGLLTLAGSIGLLAIFLAGVQLAFNAGWIVTVTYPIVGLALTAAGMIGVDAYMERRQRAALERALGDLLPPQAPSAFFISYRRSQNTWQARDFRRELVRRYGAASVFMDTSSIDYGESYPDRIASAIRGCSVMLVMIGPHWLEPIAGIRRIDDPNDWVRQEVEAGLQRREAVVVPVLLDGAPAPSEAELPESVKGLAVLNAFAVTGRVLAADIGNLVKSVERGRRRAAQRDSGSPATAPHRG